MFPCSTMPDLIVKTRNGAVSGSTMRSRKGARILSFRGIPYARPPVGDMRFRRSEPAQSWTGVLDGTKESKKCLQPNVLMPQLPFLTGGEDCLYLNVYTKQTKPSALLPVIVYIHGGAFVVGSCEAMLYGPQVLLDREVVMVGINYRLGALGFLSLETDEAPGNLGLHDQYLALLWVRDNIAQFGGDPDNVTLMGVSAGAMSATCHLVSPISRGLFHRVIALSGTMASTFMHKDRSPRCYALALASRLGYTGDKNDGRSLLSFLQTQSASTIVRAAAMFMDWDYANPMPWNPSRDSFSSQPFLPRGFTAAVQAREFSSVPVVFGLCRDEGLIYSAYFMQTKARWELLRGDWTTWAPLLFFGRERDLATDSDKQTAADIGRYYFGQDTDISGLPSDDGTISKLTRIYSMSYFYSAAHHDASVLAKAGAQVHVFILTQPPDFSLMDLFRLDLKQLCWMFTARSFGYNPYPNHYGVCHGDDNNYLFPMEPPGFPPTVVTEDQKKVQNHLLNIVSSFARDGETGAVPVLGRVWEAVEAETGVSRYLRLDTNCSMEEDTELRRELTFWDEVRLRARMEDWEPGKEVPTILHNKIAIHRQKDSWF